MEDSSQSPETFSFKAVTTGERPLTRQLREAQNIANDIPSGQLIISRNEHIAPAFQQMAPTDILNRDHNQSRKIMEQCGAQYFFNNFTFMSKSYDFGTALCHRL